MKPFLFTLLMMVGIAAQAGSNPINPSQDKPTRLYVQSYQENADISDNWNYYDYDEYQNWGGDGQGQSDSKNNFNWADGSGGSGSMSYLYVWTGNDPLLGAVGNVVQWTSQQNWPASSWPNLVNGTQTGSGDIDWEVFDTIIGPPAIIKEHCNINFPYGNSWTGYNYPGTDTFEDGGCSGNYARKADAVMKLQTGGKGIPGRQNLWAIGAEATEVTVSNAATYIMPDLVFLTRPIPAQDIIIGELGQQRSDGKLWKVLPDDVERTVTPYVPGKAYYTFDITRTDKYTPTINASGHDLSEETPEFCVGQLVTFVPHWEPQTPPYIEGDSIFHWHLPGKFVNEPYQYSAYCNSYRRNDVWLAYPTTHCWYVNKPGGTCSVGMNLKFSNGQAVSVAAKGDFTIYRPQVSSVVPHGPFGAAIDTNGWPTLWLNDGPMNFNVRISSKYSGGFGLTQLVDYFAEAGVLPYIFHSTYGDYYLDGPVYYDGEHGINDIARIYDTPGMPLGMNYGTYNGHWKDYVRFTPSGGIPVTLGRIDWNWAAIAEYYIEIEDYEITSDGVDGPALYNDDSFPVWSHVKPSGD